MVSVIIYLGLTMLGNRGTRRELKYLGVCVLLLLYEKKSKSDSYLSSGGKEGGLLGLNKASVLTQRISENEPSANTEVTLFGSAETLFLTLHPHTTFGPRYLGLSQGAS